MGNPALGQRFVLSAAEILKAREEGAEFLEIPAPIPSALGALVCLHLIKIAEPIPLWIDCGDNHGLFLTLQQMGAKYLRYHEKG